MVSSTTAAPGVFASLTDSVEGRWPFRVEVRGVEYVLDTYGWASGADSRGEYMTLPVFPVGGGDRRKVTVREDTHVRILSYVGNWAPNREVFV